jgi:hypothetical protein
MPTEADPYPASSGEVPIQLGQDGWAQALQPQSPDPRGDVALDVGPVARGWAGLDAGRVGLDPLGKVLADCQRRTVDILSTAGCDPRLVPGCLGRLLGGEAGHPLGSGSTRLWVRHPDDVGPAGTTLDDPVTKLAHHRPSFLARSRRRFSRWYCARAQLLVQYSVPVLRWPP